MQISIIMRTKNSDWVVGQTLKSLYSQTFQDFELIIVDSGSTDNTLNIIKNYPHRLIEIAATKYYPGPVLNMAINETKTDIIIFLNSDSVMLTPYSLEKLIIGFKDKEIDAVLARQLPRPEADNWVIRDYELSFPDSDKTPDWITLSLPLAGFRKSLWKKHNFYGDAWASEDTEFGNWIINNKYKIKYIKDSLTMHSHNYTLKQIYGRKFVEGEADVFIYKRFDNFGKLIIRFIKSTISDILYHIKKFDLKGLIMVIPRKFIYQYAYYKGSLLGKKRYLSGDKDSSIGQVNVLSRY